MIKHTEFAQGSLEWHAMRAGKPTAGGLGNLITDGLEVRTGEMPNTYLAQKLAEAWYAAQGLQLESLESTWAMEQGTLLEEEVIPWLACLHDIHAERVGCILTDDGRVECSPDGIAGQSGIEIKSPQPKQHCKTLLTGIVPKEHLAQIHGGMFVTGFESWLFVSYRRDFPKLVLTVERDYEVMENIRVAIEMFLEKFDAGWKKLCEMNDGPPAPRPHRNSKPQPMPEITYMQ